jgi:branched-chain amino acid transport system permease protein
MESDASNKVNPLRRLAVRAAWLAVAVICLLAGNYLNGQLLDYWADIIQQCGYAIILAVSLNIVNGLTGQFAIGHAGFMSVGAYTGASVTFLAAAKFAPNGKLDIFWMLPALLAGGSMAALFGLIVGIPSLRLRGDYLAIVTLGFGEIIRVLLENSHDLTPQLDFMGGATGFQNIPQLTNFLLIYAIVIIVVVLSFNLKFSSHGLAFMSIREDEIAADAMGINTTRAKVAAFVLSAFIAGVGGVLFAHARLIQPRIFGFILSMNYVVMIVLGGIGSITGATLAAIVLTMLPALLKPVKDRIHFTDEYLQVIYALILVLMMILRPSGVFGMGELSLKWLRKRRGASSSDTEAQALSPPPTAPKRPRGAGTVLNIKQLTRRFGGLTAVGEVNIRLESGELVGLIGPNGAGKTTLFNLMTGVYEPSEGTIEFDGGLLAGERPCPPTRRAVLLIWDAVVAGIGGWLITTIIGTAIMPYPSTPGETRMQLAIRYSGLIIGLAVSLARARNHRRNLPGYRPYQFAQRGISRTFQNIRLFGNLTVLENVRIGSYLRRRTNLFDALFKTARLENEERESIERARDLLARFNLLRVQNELAKNLPYGDQRRLEIVRALATEPKLLLLDEPAAGMNPQEKANLMTLIRQIRDDFGLTILLIEHDMKLVMGICERIYVLDYGRIIAEGIPEEIRANPKVIAAYLGEELAEEPSVPAASAANPLPEPS